MPANAGCWPREYRIPALSFRGTPTGIDVERVVATRIAPVMDAGVAGRNGGQIGAGLMTAPLGCFEAASAAYHERYPTASPRADHERPMSRAAEPPNTERRHHGGVKP
jgi:hypothetical protein